MDYHVGEGFEQLWRWFKPKDKFLIIPRILLHEMPDEWQDKFARLLEEYRDTFKHDTLNLEVTNYPEWMNNVRNSSPEINHLKSTEHRITVTVECEEFGRTEVVYSSKSNPNGIALIYSEQFDNFAEYTRDVTFINTDKIPENHFIRFWLGKFLIENPEYMLKVFTINVENKY